MENLQNNSSGAETQELSALARVFGDFLKRKAIAEPESVAKIGEKLITAREAGNSFILLDDEEIASLNANKDLLTGPEALLVLEENRLYLFREHRNETTLAHAIASRLQQPPPENPFSAEKIRETFQQITSAPGKTVSEPHENQIAAVANALSGNFSIITGGPGTGKTTIIATLVALERERDPDIIIEIAAPTGKAAELLSAGLEQAFPQHPVSARTLHSLFRARPGTGKFEKNSADPLECDLLIVDECSMISLDVAAKMFNGLRPETRVVLSGDHRQLEAVGSGAVLSSLLTFVSDNSPGAEMLKKAGVELTHNYRSTLAPVIQELAADIRREMEIELLCQKITEAASANYAFKKADKNTGNELLKEASEHWKELPEICSEITEESVNKAFAKLNSFRIVTAARTGQEGCVKLNERICEALGINSLHAPGSALLITQNCRRTNLSNGDVGVVFADRENGGVKVCFKDHPEPFSFYDLPAFESAFAMTVHKAQGSGFAEVCFPMPTKETPLLTRELFYTALTRAAVKITIYGTSEMVRAALKNKSCRATTLAERIIEELPDTYEN